MKFFVSYRHQEPDKDVADFLAQGLRQAGQEVFIDTGMAVGTGWAEEIEARIGWCDLLVVLLSEAATESEMVRTEIRLARLRGKREGTPRILPVRVRHFGTLDYELESYLGGLHYAKWQDSRDSCRVLRNLLELADDPTRVDGLQPPTLEPRNDRDQLHVLREVELRIQDFFDGWLYRQMLVPRGFSSQPELVDDRLGTFRRPRREHDAEVESTLVETFERANKNLLILGEGGSGKSLTLLELARCAHGQAESTPSEPLPVVLELSRWRGASLAEWLVDELNRIYGVARGLARQWLADKELMLLLDGLDEVDPGRQAECIRAINVFRTEEGYGSIPVVVSSRLESYRDHAVESRRLALRDAVVLEPLTPEKVDAYLAAAGSELAGLRQAVESDVELRELALSPLMLNVMSLAYRDRTAETLLSAGDTEDPRGEIFDAYVDRMFEHPRGGAGGEERYSRQDTVGWLSWLAGRMLDHGQTSFLLEELQPSWLETHIERWVYALSSRSLTGLVFGLAWLLQGSEQMALLVFGLAGGLGVGLVDGLRFAAMRRRAGQLPKWMDRTLYTAGIIAVAALAPMLAARISGDPESGYFAGLMFAAFFLLWRRRRGPEDDVRALGALSPSWTGAALGALPGPVAALGLWISLPWLGAAPVLILGVSLALAGGIVGGLRGQRFDPTIHRRHGIRRSARYALIASAILPSLAILVGLTLAWWLGRDLATQGLGILHDSVILVAPMAVILALGYGGMDTLQHVLLRRLLRVGNRIPQRFPSFLDFAADRIFLRRQGAGYRFIHRALQEHFAALPSGR